MKTAADQSSVKMNWFTKTVRALSPNCKEAIRLQSDALDRPLPWLQRVGLRIHLVLCVWCARYAKQVKFLHAAAQQCDHDHAAKPVMPAEARARIKRRLQSENNP
jgi:hypothetical protein